MDTEIIIKHSDFTTSNEIIYDIMDIEKDVFKEKERGHYDSIERRFNRNKEMFVLAYDKDKLIGYLCFFPISKRLHDDILNSNKFFDDNIKEEDVLLFEKENYLYLISIALYKKYQGLGIGKMMMDAFFTKVKELKDKGCNVSDILASAVSSQGEMISKKYNFTMFKDLSKEYGYKLMYLKGAEIC